MIQQQQQSNQIFEINEVKNNYIKLFQSPDKNSAKIANTYLMELQYSQQAWQIAQQLLIHPQNNEKILTAQQQQQIQFLGSQILYGKTKTEFSKLDQNHITELRNFIFQTMSNPDLNLIEPCYRQLCSCIGIIGLCGISEHWPTMVNDIIKFMQQGQKNLYLGLEILQAFAKDIGFIIIDRTVLDRIKNAAAKNSAQIFEIFNSLLSQPNLSSQTLEKCIDCLIDWTSQNLRLQDSEFIQKVRDFFEEAYQNSNTSDLLIIQTLEPEVQFTQQEKLNHAVVIQMLQTMRKDFQICMQSRTQNSEFCKVYTDLLVGFCQFYNIYLLENPDIGLQLLQMLIETVQHKSLKISLISLDFWCTLRKRFSKYLSKPEFSYIAEAYQELLKAVLFQCRYRKVEHKKHEEDEKYFYEDVKLADYRSTAEDVILQCLSAHKEKNGVNFFQDVVFQLMNTSNQDPDYLLNLEVALFAVTSVFDDESYFDSYSTFMENIFRFVVSDKFPSDYFVVSQAMQFMYNGSLQVKHSQTLLNSVIHFIVKQIDNPENRVQAAQTFSAIADGIEQHNLIDTFKYLVENFVKQLDNFESESSIQNLVQSIFTFALKLQEDQHKKEAVVTLFKIIGVKIQNFAHGQTNSEIQYLNILNILCSIFQGFDVYRQDTIELIREQIKEFLVENMQFINAFFQNYGHLQVTKFVKLLSSLIKRTKQYLPDQFVEFLNHSVKLLETDSKKNYECIQILHELFEHLKQAKNNTFNLWLQENFANYNAFIINLIKQTQDADLIREWVKMVKKSAEYNADLVTGLPNFDEIMCVAINVLQNIVNYELNRELFIFLLVFFKIPSIKNNQNFQRILQTVINGMYQSLPEINKTLLHHFSMAFNALCVNFSQNSQAISEVVFQSLQSSKYDEIIRSDDSNEIKQLYQNYKKVFAQAITQFGVQNGMKNMKLSLSDLHSLVNHQLDLKDAFTALNFKLGNEKTVVIE